MSAGSEPGAGPAAGEFDLIARCLIGVGSARPELRLGIGDDSAALALPSGSVLVTADALASPPDGLATPPRPLAHRVLATSLSRLVARGGEPLGFTLGLCLPEPCERWLRGFTGALHAVATLARISLIGGDTTRGPLLAHVVAHGIRPGTPAAPGAIRAGFRIGIAGELHSRWSADRPQVPPPLHGLATRYPAFSLAQGLHAGLAGALRGSGLGARLDAAALAAAGLPALAPGTALPRDPAGPGIGLLLPPGTRLPAQGLRLLGSVVAARGLRLAGARQR